MSKKLSVKLGEKEITYENDAELLKKFGEIVTDIFSPVSEGFGAIGDRIRMFRTKSALVALNEGKEKADAQGVSLSNLSPKFLITWSELASREDLDASAELRSLWSNLLVSAASDQKDTHVFFISILSRMSGIQAKMLQENVSVAKAKSSPEQYPTNIVAVGHSHLKSYVDTVAKFLEKYEILDSHDVQELSDEQFSELSKHSEESAKPLRELGVQIVNLEINNVLVPYWIEHHGVDELKELLLNIEMLSQLGLLKLSDIVGSTMLNNEFSYQYFRVTNLGFAFAEAVSDGSSEVRTEEVK